MNELTSLYEAATAGGVTVRSSCRRRLIHPKQEPGNLHQHETCASIWRFKVPTSLVCFQPSPQVSFLFRQFLSSAWRPGKCVRYRECQLWISANHPLLWWVWSSVILATRDNGCFHGCHRNLPVLQPGFSRRCKTLILTCSCYLSGMWSEASTCHKYHNLGIVTPAMVPKGSGHFTTLSPAVHEHTRPCCHQQAWCHRSWSRLSRALPQQGGRPCFHQQGEKPSLQTPFQGSSSWSLPGSNNWGLGRKQNSHEWHREETWMKW